MTGAVAIESDGGVRQGAGARGEESTHYQLLLLPFAVNSRLVGEVTGLFVDISTGIEGIVVCWRDGGRMGMGIGWHTYFVEMKKVRGVELVMMGRMWIAVACGPDDDRKVHCMHE